MAESDGYSDEEGRLAAYLPDDFKQYVDTQLNRCPVVGDDFGVYIFCGWVFWSREDDQSEHPPDILDLKKKIKDLLRKGLRCWLQFPALIQFWAPKMTMDGRSYLTTQNQPFALSTYDACCDDVKGPVKGFCGYRMISKDYKFYMDRESSDEQLGVPGRVFNHGFPEFSPNVEYYSIKEYPLRDHALRCQLKLSWAIPVFDPSTHLCVGVLEIVSTAPSKGFLLANPHDWRILVTCLKEVGLESSISVEEIPQLSSDQPFSQASAAIVYANPHNTVIQDANIVTVKAKYINDITIKFRLSLSSGLVELQQQIAKRLNLEAGSYYVKYKDEDGDLILIACDQDLQYYISCSTSLGSTTIIVLIVPK